PRIVVDRGGFVTIPYAGEVAVSGLTPVQAAQAIRRALRGKAVNPQVVVSVLTSPANSVTVIGEVKNSGRFPVSASNDRLLDVIAVAGGVTKPPADLIVTVVRGRQSAAIPMPDLMADASQNIRLAPGDQVRLIFHERKVNAVGALGRVSQFPIEDDSLTLAGALSRIGGLDTNAANPSAVLLFRFERPEVARALGLGGGSPAVSAPVPIIYRLNLREGAGFFLAEKFPVQADDLIDVPRSNTTEIQKFFAIVNSAAGTAYQASVIRTAVP
ncbi:MAG: polysaccharide biosynthesis/export family protein, partial [Caulobacteraceae bacterium]